MNLFHMIILFAGLMVVSPPALAEIHWDMPTPYGDNTFHTVNIRQFADEVKAATQGELVITVHSAGSLIKHPEIKNTVRRGLVPIGELIMSRLGNEDPVFEVDAIPFLTTSYQEAGELWEASRPIIEQKLDRQGLRLLFAVPWPPQGIYARQELETVDDLKGITLRAYNKITERLARLAGAIPTQVEVPDIPTAFTTGRVDAMITSPTTGVDTKAWDYVSHFHDTRAWLPKNMVIVNQRVFARLDTAIQEAVLEAARQAQRRGWEMSRTETAENLEILRQNGMVIVESSDALMQGLRQIGRILTDEWLKATGPEGRAILEAYRQ